MIHMEMIVTIVITIIGSNALWGFLQWLIDRKDRNHDRFGEIIRAIGDLSTKIDTVDTNLSKKIDAVDTKGDERAAVNSRVRILRFADEMQENRHHSKDSWDQVMSDISDYNEYCEAHPKFRNGQTAATVEYLTNSYQDRLKKRDW